MTASVIVIGCGPAGLAAAHAAAGHGATVRIYAPRAKTPQRGPLLIQRPIPGINTDHPDGTIHQLVIGGGILDYRYKLYGDINIGINGNILQPFYHAWRHAETYDRLWSMYSGQIIDRVITPEEMSDIHLEADLVVTTASMKDMCYRNHVGGRGPEHVFEQAPVRVSTQASYPSQPDNTIVFNAKPDIPWVRSSRIFGNEVTEWVPRSSPPVSSRIIFKPISTTCDCYPLVLRTGRFGAWRNETWVDTAYWDTYSAVEGMLLHPDIRAIA
jgi:hypothetical protein